MKPSLAVEVMRAEEAARNDFPPLFGHVLVAEKNSLNRGLIGAYLGEFGLTHEPVDSAAGFILRLVAKTYDLVLLDTALPGFDGVDAATHFRGLHGPASRVPLVGLVPDRLKIYCGNYLAAGMNTYVVKPIRARELYAALTPFLPAAERSIRTALAS